MIGREFRPDRRLTRDTCVISEKPASSGKQKSSSSSSNNTTLQNGPGTGGSNTKPTELTWVHEIFQGTLTNETRCLNCETVSI